MDNLNPNILNCICLFSSDPNEISLTFDDEVLEEACLKIVLVRYDGIGTPFL